MEKAAELLRGTQLSIREIAVKVGYAGGNYFCKAFRRTVGTSPGAFRSGKDMPPVDRIRID